MNIVYQTERYVAVIKPAGVLIHRTGRTTERAALQIVRDLLGVRVHPIHRLDRGTHGLLLFALDPDAARQLSALFSAGAVDKQYLAIVRGYPPPSGTIDWPLIDEDSSSDVPRDARTEFATLSTIELPIAVGSFPTARYASVALRPLTGRTHQLRRHLAHLRHPIVGDVRHGDGKHNRLFREHFGCHRMLLFARRLAFLDPFDGEHRDLEAPLDPQAAQLLQQLGLADLQTPSGEPAP